MSKKEKASVYHGFGPPPLIIDRSIFQKTEKEKEKLKVIKQEHKASLKARGLDPKKRMNISPSMSTKS